MFDLRINFLDFHGQKAVRVYKIDAADIGAAQALAAGIIADADAVSMAQLTSATITLDMDVSGTKAAALQGHTVTQAAKLSLFITTDKFAVHSIPAPIEALFTPGSRVVDINNPTLQGYASSVFPNITVSDDEFVDTALGATGIRQGILVSRSSQKK